MAERCQFLAYFLYSIIITGWVYPPVSHWAWDSSGPSQNSCHHQTIKIIKHSSVRLAGVHRILHRLCWLRSGSSVRSLLLPRWLLSSWGQDREILRGRQGERGLDLESIGSSPSYGTDLGKIREMFSSAAQLGFWLVRLSWGLKLRLGNWDFDLSV